MGSVVRPLGHFARPLLTLLLFGLTASTLRAQSHFSCADGTGNIFNATVIVTIDQTPDIDGVGLAAGSEVAVFSADPNYADFCVGKLIWQESSGSITVWGDDYLTPERDGLLVGNDFLFRIWDSQSGQEYAVDPNDISYQLGDGRYDHDALIVLSRLSVSTETASLVANNDTATTVEDRRVEIDVLANDNGGSSSLDPSSIAILNPPKNGLISDIDRLTGLVTYVPNVDFFGSDSFIYVVFNSDGDDSKTATVDIEIASVNDVPIARADAVTMEEDGEIVISVLSNDSDVDDGDLDRASVVVHSPPVFGEILTIDPISRDVTYRPGANYYGQDSFTYAVVDPHGAESEVVNVDILINSVNDAPVAVADVASTKEDFQVKIDVLDNDSDVDGDEIDPSSVKIRSFPSNGSIKNVQRGSGTVTYQPDPDFNGVDSFTYKVRDIHGQASSEVLVQITIDEVNDAPKFRGHPIDSTPKGKKYRYQAVFTDAENDAVAISAVVSPGWLTVTDNGDGTATLEGTPSDFEIGSHDVQLFADDGRGGTTTYAFIIVVAENAGPLGADDLVTVQEDGRITIDVLANDTDPEGDALDITSITIVKPPSNGAIDYDPTSGTVTYVPNADFNGSDSFEYVVSDETGNQSNVVQVDISVLPVSDAPVAVGETVSTREDSQVIIDVLKNDLDVDGDLLSITEVIGSANADIQIGPDGDDVTYTPAPDFNGIDTFAYTVVDPEGLKATAVVIVHVESVNDPPSVTSTPETVLSAGALYTYVIETEDIDGDPVTVRIGSAPTWLILTSGENDSYNLKGAPTVAHLGHHLVILEISDGVDTVQQEFTLAVSDIEYRLTAKTILRMPFLGEVEVSTNTRFTWDRVVYSLQYQLQVAEASDMQFEHPLFDRTFLYGTSASNSIVGYMVFNLPSDVSLIWRVRAQNVSGFSPWSDVNQYSTSAATSTPTEILDEIPTSTILFQNYPNPFNPTTTILFDLPSASDVTLTIYDVTGRVVTTLLSRTLLAGQHEVRWNADGQASGLYLYRLRAGSFSKSKTMALVR